MQCKEMRNENNAVHRNIFLSVSSARAILGASKLLCMLIARKCGYGGKNGLAISAARRHVVWRRRGAWRGDAPTWHIA